MEDHNSIIIDHLSHSFDSIFALKDVSLRIPHRSLLAITGPNGGGKSTLLKIIYGVLKPFSGCIKTNLATIAYLPQVAEINRSFPLTVSDVVGMAFWRRALYPWQKTPSDAQDRIISTLTALGLSKHAHKFLIELSGGEYQRVLFARLILQEADLILLDEPFTAIDDMSLHILIEAVHKLHANGKTVITVIHQRSMIRKYFPDTLILSGHVIAYGKTKNVLIPVREEDEW